MNWETNDWDPARYADYAIQRLVGSATDTIPFSVPPRANDGVGVTSKFNTPEFGRFSASLAVNRLHDVGVYRGDEGQSPSRDRGADLAPYR